MVAERADVWLTSTFETEPGDLTRLSGVLDDHCHAIGRDPRTLRRAVQLPVPEKRDDILRAAESFIRAGFATLVFMPRGGGLGRVEEVAGLLDELR